MPTHIEPSFEQARRANLNEVRLKAGVGPQPNGAVISVADQPIAGIAIDASSDVDSFYLISRSISTLVSVEQPLVSDILCPWEINLVSGYGSTIIPDNGSGTPTAFDPPSNPSGRTPVLLARLFLRPPPQLFSRRAPFTDVYGFSEIKTGPKPPPPVIVGDTDEIIHAWAIPGRRHARVSVYLNDLVPGQHGGADVRLTGTPGNGYSMGLPDSMYEVQVSTPQHLMSPQPFTFSVATPTLYWLFLRAIGTGPKKVIIRTDIEAWD